MYQQSKNINDHIKRLFSKAENPENLQVICDISEAPAFLQFDIIKNITEGLDSTQLDHVNIVF